MEFAVLIIVLLIAAAVAVAIAARQRRGGDRPGRTAEDRTAEDTVSTKHQPPVEPHRPVPGSRTRREEQRRH